MQVHCVRIKLAEIKLKKKNGIKPCKMVPIYSIQIQKSLKYIKIEQQGENPVALAQSCSK